MTNILTRSARTKLTPPELARRWGVSPDKILAWIRAGELRAFNAALRSTGRPRWLIDEVDAICFQQRRAATPTPQTRRRKRLPEVVEYF